MEDLSALRTPEERILFGILSVPFAAYDYIPHYGTAVSLVKRGKFNSALTHEFRSFGSTFQDRLENVTTHYNSLLYKASPEDRPSIVDEWISVLAAGVAQKQLMTLFMKEEDERAFRMMGEAYGGMCLTEPTHSTVPYSPSMFKKAGAASLIDFVIYVAENSEHVIRMAQNVASAHGYNVRFSQAQVSAKGDLLLFYSPENTCSIPDLLRLF